MKLPPLKNMYIKIEKKAFSHLMELNAENFKNWKEENNNKKNLEQFCKEYCIEQEPLINFYSMYKNQSGGINYYEILYK